MGRWFPRFLDHEALPHHTGLLPGLTLGANAMDSDAAATRTSGFPRLVFPTAVTTTAWITFGLPPYWESVVVGWDWVNDHVAGGNVRWVVTLRGNNVGSTIATPEFSEVADQVLPAPGAGAQITNLAFINEPITHGPFGTLWALEMSRVGGGADTLAGPVGLQEVVISQGST